MQVGDLVRVPQYSYVTGFVGIVTSVNHLGSALVTSMCGKRSIEALLSDSAIIETENDDGTTITLIDGTITPKCSFSDEWTENNN
jgi:hypothetical protein